MRIACLQFSPQLGNLPANILRADTLLSSAPNLHNLDFLILPELALTGYNFPSLAAISPFLEPTAAGPSTEWARKTATRLRCIVVVGYPELASSSFSGPPPSLNGSLPVTTDETPPASNPTCYNSLITISPQGDVLAHYRKTHLYYTDETWAQPSPSGFLTASLPLPSSSSSSSSTSPFSSFSNIPTSFGICMDINPHKFTAPWSAYELSTHVLRSSASLLICSMAWLSFPPNAEIEEKNKTVPDKETLGYWVDRLEPLVAQGEREVLVVMVNRCGMEEPDVRYVGTSWVGKVGRGKVKFWGLMGKGEEGVLVVDTKEVPKWGMRVRDKGDG